jgi:hypothetical protein
MNRRTRSRNRPRQQINILHTTTTQKRASRKQVMQMLGWCGLVTGMVLAVGTAMHFGASRSSPAAISPSA